MPGDGRKSFWITDVGVELEVDPSDGGVSAWLMRWALGLFLWFSWFSPDVLSDELGATGSADTSSQKATNLVGSPGVGGALDSGVAVVERGTHVVMIVFDTRSVNPRATQ